VTPCSLWRVRTSVPEVEGGVHIAVALEAAEEAAEHTLARAVLLVDVFAAVADLAGVGCVDLYEFYAESFVQVFEQVWRASPE
jgi:hypothetical protein